MKKSHTRLISAPLHGKHSRKGSTLMVVMIVMFLVSMVAASLLTRGTQEKDFTFRRIEDVEGRHVLESAVEIAMAELQERFRNAQTLMNVDTDITLDSAMRSFLTSNKRYVTDVRITNVEEMKFASPIFVDNADPDTLLDPHRGSFVRVSEWRITAEADVRYRGRTRQMRASQTFQVRESPFFTHAILYNMDLEFHPGPEMTINGPVHSNSRIWAVAQNRLHFLDRVSATEGIHIGGMMHGHQTNWGTGYLSNQNGGNVWFNTNGRNPTGDNRRFSSRDGRSFAPLWDGAGSQTLSSSFFDSRSEDSGKLLTELGFTGMTEFLSNWFDGNVAMGSIEAPIIRSQFIPNYVPEDGTGPRLNHGYALIEPLMPPLGPDGLPNRFHKGNGEQEKFAFKAGMTFEVRHLPGFDESVLGDDELHWRRLWRLGSTPIPRNDFGRVQIPPSLLSETFSGHAEGTNLRGLSGWDTNVPPNRAQIVEETIRYTNNEVTHTRSENSVRLSLDGSSLFYAWKGFDPTSDEVVYFSALVQMDANNADAELLVGLTSGSNFTSISGGLVSVTNGNSGIRSRIGSNMLNNSHRTQSSTLFRPVNLETYMIVGRLSKSNPDGNYNRFGFIINPMNTTSSEITDWTVIERDTTLEEVDTFFMRVGQNRPDSNFLVSDVRIGTQFNEVVTGLPAGATNFWLIPKRVRQNDDSANVEIELVDDAGNPLVDEDNNRITETILGTNHDPIYIEESVFHQVFRARIYDEGDDGRPVENGGLYDKRDLKPQDLIDFNMTAFRTEIAEITGSDVDRFVKTLEDGTEVTTFIPSQHYNGIVYFQFPIVLRDRPDNIVVAQDNFRPFFTRRIGSESQVVVRQDFTSLSLFVHSARQLPDPSFNNDAGFTLVSNSRIYIKGSYNADGVFSTGSSVTGAGEPDEYNVLAAIVGDAITFLSDEFTVTRSKNHTIPVASFTEVNAALMAGILPTNSTDFDGRYTPRDGHPISGGSHNFHRFLENFSNNNNNNRVFRYRGSMVVFFESEVSRSPQEQNGNTWYGAPIRDYGFFDRFGLGFQPPGTPMARTFFKMDFRFL